MTIKALSAIAAAALAVPGLAQAEFDYNFLEFSYVDVEIDDSSVDGDGFRLEGSSEVGDSFLIHAEYEDYDFDFGIDASTFEIGGGYVHSMSDDLDFVATGQFVQVEIEDFDDDGLGIGGGIRARVADAVEVDAMLNWVDFDEFGSDTYIDLRGRYYFTPQFAFSLNLALGSDTFETMALGVRYNFQSVGGFSD